MGKEASKKNGLYDRVVSSIINEGLEIIELPGAKPNPELGLVNEGIRICRENKVDCILAVGGGSVIDSAKAISMGVAYLGDVWDFFEGKAEVKDTLPLGVILTIAGSGSESSSSTVITNENGLIKRSVSYDMLRPQFAIMNPELTFTVSGYQTACGIADAMTHVMERYFTSAANNDCTDKLCEAVLETLILNGPPVLKEPESYDARAEIMWACKIAHDNTVGVGRVADYASHKIEHELSGIYGVSHGAGMAVIFPAWMKYVYKHDLNRFVRFAQRVWNVQSSMDSPEKAAQEGINRLIHFFKGLGLPTTLSELGINEERFEEIAEKCTKTKQRAVGNFLKIYRDDVINILKLACCID